MKLISEGKARLYTGDNVFYNPEMKTLRDVSVLFLKAISTKRKRVLDATAATGVRAIRYALEAGAKDVTLLDINARAARVAKKNVGFNHLKFEVLNLSIQEFANTHRGSFEIIDLDPFGSPSPDVYDIMKLCWDGTILMITATDTAVLCGAHEGGVRKDIRIQAAAQRDVQGGWYTDTPELRFKDGVAIQLWDSAARSPYPTGTT